MAEFCLDCWNKINETNDSKWRYAFSWNKDLREECGQYKRVIVEERFWSRTQRVLAEAIKNIQNQSIRKADTLTSSRFTITYYFKALKAFLLKSEE